MRLFGKFMSSPMISFAVRSGGSGMGVGGKVVEFGSSIVRALWHGFPLSDWMLFSPDAFVRLVSPTSKKGNKGFLITNFPLVQE